jgi:hypothetical protein
MNNRLDSLAIVVSLRRESFNRRRHDRTIPSLPSLPRSRPGRGATVRRPQTEATWRAMGAAPSEAAKSVCLNGLAGSSQSCPECSPATASGMHHER